MIEMILDELKDYFRDEGFKVNFEVIDDLSTYVYFESTDIYDIDVFYKKVTRVTHNFGKDVVSLSKVDIVHMGELYLLISIEDPRRNNY